MMNSKQIKTFEDLEVWNRSIELAKDLYEVFKGKFNDPLVNQLLRAAVSISNNIAEGHDRGGTKEYIRFLYISRGSCAEFRSVLILAKNIGVINRSEIDGFIERTLIITRMLSALIKSLKKRL